MPVDPPSEPATLNLTNLFKPAIKLDLEFSRVKAAANQRVEQWRNSITQGEDEEKKSFFFSSPASFHGKIVQQAELAGQEKVIALTFDDGPWIGTTEKVLNILNQYQVKATFFWIGKHLKLYPHIAKKVVAEGHAIGNHTWHHPYRVNTFQATREIEDTATLIYQVTGVKTSLFRPPGGVLNNGLAAYAQQQKYTVMMWSADSRDWNTGISTSTIIDNVLRNARSGGIVLLHDGGGNRWQTVEALPVIIAEFKNRGYKFVTVPELLQMEENENKLQSK
ncbi:polysaccharide deacetylase family protein [Microcoleus sp. FACHB-68]|nr:polysaccharide deacetylase family protein [Microcoleus sp. FACHB-68]MBD1939363.1 polysaccharide deacetylase family protein [Microcoleus sp. FACHB-68]